MFFKRGFRHGGEQPTHLAYNPDGTEPMSPLSASEDYGPQVNALVKRPRHAPRESGSSAASTTSRASSPDARADEVPTTAEKPSRRKKSLAVSKYTTKPACRSRTVLAGYVRNEEEEE